MITTPSAGNVSKPENGGAKKAAAAKISMIRPISEIKRLFSMSSASRGRLRFSSLLTPLTNLFMVFPLANACNDTERQRSGSQTACLPAIISRASSIVITSNIWVKPPVGTGSAGMDMSNRIRIEKLSRENTCNRLPSVLSPLLLDQSSSSWANCLCFTP